MAVGLLVVQPSSALTPTSEAVAVEAASPAADILDVDFQDGAPVDRVAGVTPTFVGSPTYATHYRVGVMSLSSSAANFTLPEEKWAQLADTDGASVECIVRLDAAPNGRPICGSQASATNFSLTAAATGFQASFVVSDAADSSTTLGTFTSTLTDTPEQGRWYHVVGVFDGTQVTVYVNGVAGTPAPVTKAGEPVPGIMRFNSNAPRMLMIGGNPTKAGAFNGSAGPAATYSAARIYSTPLAADEVSQLATEIPAVPPTADALRVDFQDGIPVDRAGGVTPTFVGEPSYSTVHGTGVMSLTQDAANFTMPPATWATLSDTDGMSVECIVRLDAAPNGRPICGASASATGFSLSVGTTGFQATFVANGAGTTTSLGTFTSTFAGAPEQGRWYHVLGVFDGTQVIVYVNGEAATPASLPGPGIVRVNGNTPKMLMIGGTPTTAGAFNGSPGPSATYAAARIYGTPLSAVQAELLADERPSDAPEIPEPDVLDVDFRDSAPVDRAGGVTPVITGAPRFANEHGVGVMSIAQDAASFTLPDDKWAKLTDADGLSVQCVVRLDSPANGRPVCGAQANGTNFSLTASTTGFQATFVVADATDGTSLGSFTSTFSGALETGKWYDVVGVLDGTNVVVYVNGVAATPAVLPGRGVMRFTSSAPRMVMIGGNPTVTGTFNGSAGPSATYSAVRVYSKPMSAAAAAQVATDRPSDDPIPPGGPAPDILDVDFATAGEPVDHATGVPAQIYGGTPAYSDSGLLSQVSNANIAFDLSREQWALMSDANGLSFECVVKYDLSVFPDATFCGSAAAGNNFYLNATGGYPGAFFRIGNGYQSAISPVQMESGRWYSIVGVFDGKEVKLYVDGKLAAQKQYAGRVVHRDTAPTIVGTNGNPDTSFDPPLFRAGSPAQTTAHHAMRLWSNPLDAADVAARYQAQFGDIRDGGVERQSSTPAAGDRLTKATTFRFAARNAQNAINWRYLLDGQDINPGQEIGAGLAAGNHRITVTATSILGLPLSWQIPFTSAAIPVAGGTRTEQGDGKVQLSVVAEAPDGGEVTTTFKKADVGVAEGGYQGTVRSIPTTLDFEADDRTELTGTQVEDGETSDTDAAHDALPFQRFDVKVPAGESPSVRWKGVIDPQRAIRLFVWDLASRSWAEVASSRGSETGSTVVTGAVPGTAIDDGTVRVLAIGEDPFADDLAPRDASAGDAENRDHFEDPEDYDFSFVHWTDPQGMAQSATGGDVPGAVYSSETKTAEEQALFAEAYRDALQWSVANMDSKKIAYFANTGDVTNTGYVSDLPEEHTALQLRLADAEWDFTTDAFNTALNESGLVSQIVGGNHDVLGATENSGGDSTFSQRFTAASWYEQSQHWPAGASFHTMDETTDPEGTTATPGQNIDNNYVLFSAAGLDFVAVGLSYGVTPAEAAWASSIFDRYKDRNGILMTHAYLNASSAQDGRNASLTGEWNGDRGGEALYEEVVVSNPNVFLVLAGHTHGVGYNVKSDVGPTVDTKHGVVEFMANYQGYTVPAAKILTAENCPTCVVDAAGNIDTNGDGTIDRKGTDLLTFGPSFLNLLQFNVKDSTVSVDNYSPFMDEFGASKYDPNKRYTGAADNLTVPVDLSSRTTSIATDAVAVMTETDEVIGVATAPSGWPATVVWSGLATGETYGWTAASNAVSDPEGMVSQVGGVFLASAAGTDVSAPVLTVPAATTIDEGTAFDPMADVTATDDVDGDVSSSIQLVGEVDTGTPGRYALIYSVSDTNGNVSQAQRVVTVTETPLASTSVKASGASATYGQKATVMVTVAGDSPSGTVEIRNGATVLGIGRLSDGTTPITIPAKALPPGRHTLLVAYGGDGTDRPSTGSVNVVVAKAAAKVRAKVKPRKVKVLKKARLVVRVTAADGVTPTGKVKVKVAGKTRTARVKGGKAIVKLPGLKVPGKKVVRIVYAGDRFVARKVVKARYKVVRR